MALVFSAEMVDLHYQKDGEDHNAKASTVKLLLLAYADHANDNGRGAYPGYDKLEIKTALSRQGIADTLEAIQQNAFMIFEGKSELGTNSYKINLEKLKTLVKPLDSAKSSHFTSQSQAARLKPSINHPKPSNAATPRGNQIPEVVLYREVAKKYPPTELYSDVVTSIGKITARLGRIPTCDDLLPFRKAWVSKGYNPFAITWLEWAEDGKIPQNGTWKPKAQIPVKVLSESELKALQEKADKEFAQ